MKNQFIKANRPQILAALKSGSIDRRIDKMDLSQVRNFILLQDASKAAQDDRYKNPTATVAVKVYVTSKAGMYGHQFIAAIWVRTPEGGHYQASGTMTGGCGYDKPSTAVDSAIRALGLDYSIVSAFEGTGQHWDALRELMQVLAGRKQWFEVN